MKKFFQFLAVVCFFLFFFVMLPLMEVTLNNVAASQINQSISQIEPVIGSMMTPHVQIAIYSDGYPCQANAPPTAHAIRAIFVRTMNYSMEDNLNAAIPVFSMTAEPSLMIINI